MEEEAVISVSELDLDQLLSAPCQIPHSVDAVLRKVEAAELDRAKRDVAEQLLVILTSVNMALYRMRLATEVEEEEAQDASQHQEEKKKRSQQLLSIRAFLQSSLDKESHLGAVLQWLQDINEELLQVEEDEDLREVQNITAEWVEHMEKKIQTSMCDIQACVLRLHQLCGSLLGLDTQKTKKKDAAVNKAGVWRWWREAKVDARTILKIQELQPPSVERILADPSLGAKSAQDLGFMLGDMSKSLSCNKAMSMAFRFLQTGLQNLNEALQERARDAQRAQAQLEELRADDAHVNLARARTELEGMRRRLAKTEEENKGLMEENAAHLVHIRQLQGAPRGHQAPAIMEVMEELVDFPLPGAPTQEPGSPAPAKPTLPKRPCQPKKQPRVKEPAVPRLESSEAPSLAAPVGEHEALEVDLFEGVTYDEETPPSLESMSEGEARPEPSLDSLDMLEAVEKRSTSLLSDFQSSVFSIIEKSLSMRPGAGLAGEMQGLGLEADKANDAIKLYIILQKTIRDSFNNLTSKLQGKFTESVLEMPFLDDQLGQAGFWDDTSKSPGEMLKEINRMFIRHERDIRSVDSSVRVLMSDKKATPAWSRSRKGGTQRRHSLSEVLGQLKSINDMSKQQACKMRLALESLLDMQQKIQKEPIVDQRVLEEEEEEEEEEVQPVCPTSIPSSDSLEEEEVHLEKRCHQVERPARVERRARRASPDKNLARRRPTWAQVRGGSAPKKDLQRYRAEMEEEVEKIQSTVMAGATYQFAMASQRTNLHLLKQAAVDGSISSELYSLARQLIRQNRSLDQARLACLLHKFMAFRSVQQVRYNLNMQLLAARKLNDGQTVKDMYSFLIRLDQYQNRVLVRWNGRQAEIDRTRRSCLAHVLYLFTEITKDCNLPLVQPTRCSSQSHSHFLSLKTRPRKTVLSFSSRRRLRPCPLQAAPAQLATPGSEVGPLSGVRRLLRGQLPAVWSSSRSESSEQLARKPPARPASFPSIPQLLNININRSRNTAFCSALDRVARGPQLLAWEGM